MSSAARHLDDRQAAPAAADQQVRDRRAGEDLGRRDPVSSPARSRPGGPDADRPIPRAGRLAAMRNQRPTSPSGKNEPHRDRNQACIRKSSGRPPVMRSLGTEREDLAPLTEIQERTLRRTQLLKLKAEAELARLEKSPPPDAGRRGMTRPPARTTRRMPAAAKSKPVDPKQIKAGYQKAIELAPQSRRADGTGGQVAQAKGSLRLPTRRPKRRGRFSRKFKKRSPSKISRIRNSRIRTRRTRTRRSRIRRIKQKKDQQKKEQQKKDDRREEGRAEEGSGTEEAGRAEEVRRAETGSEAATAAGLARSDRRGTAQGPRTAAGKARTRPQDEGPRVRAEFPWRRIGDAT